LQGRAARLLDLAQIPELYRKASFDNFIVPGVENIIARRELTTVLLAVKQFVRDFPNEKRPGLMLIGETGAGKTHLAVAALREIIGRGFQGLFCNYVTLLHSIREGYDEISNISDKAAYSTALNAEVLLIDDLGAHRVTAWVEDTINTLLTFRCDKRMPVIVTTNMPDPAARSVMIETSEIGNKKEYRRTLAEAIGERARSRLFEMCTVLRMPLTEDYRVQKGKLF
jgi:DNA replication protein DnaC